MDRILNFVRSELFLSLAGGFALGVAGMAIIKPANADSKTSLEARSISVSVQSHDASFENPSIQRP
jgi:hypothetical protein